MSPNTDGKWHGKPKVERKFSPQYHLQKFSLNSKGIERIPRGQNVAFNWLISGNV
jgi:hypothetical protein